MAARSLIQQRSLKVGLIFLFWTLIGLSFASQLYLLSNRAGSPMSWRHAVSLSLGDWYVWAVLSIPVIRLARRFRFDGSNWGRNVAIHLLASAICSLLYMVMRAWLAQWQRAISGAPVTFAEAFGPLLLKTFNSNLLIYWVMVSVSHAFDYYRQYQERVLRGAELERHLAEARLQALQMQLNPHFLFNTLHTISALVHRDAAEADRMIARLSDLLRYALESTSAQEVPLRQELAFLERYLEIEQTRFGDRLTVVKDIDPATLDALVPNLVLQPLVENAIRHGIEPHAKRGRIDLVARRAGADLQLEVRDNGRGLPARQKHEEGVGLSNTRARLETLYGGNHRFDLENAPDGGLVAGLTIPWRPAEPK